MSDYFDKLRMKNLAGIAIGRVNGTSTGLAVGGNTENLDTATGDSATNFFGPQGALLSTIQNTDIDLSDTDYCAEAGVTVSADTTEFALFVLQDGVNSPIVRLGEETVRKTRSGVNGALTTEKVRLTLPKDVDNETYVVTGYARVTQDGTAVYVVGTTAIAVAGAITVVTLVETCNLLAGTRVA